MTPQMALELTQRALMTAMMLGAPVLVTTMLVGVALNIFQTITSIKDMSLTFVHYIKAFGFGSPSSRNRPISRPA